MSTIKAFNSLGQMPSKVITKVSQKDLHISKPTWWLESRYVIHDLSLLYYTFFRTYRSPADGLFRPFSSAVCRFHFSFADWWEGKQSFGALRVMNDDLVKPRAGFGSHPHRDAEIFSYVVNGQLTHADSMGNKESLGRGGVQYMSAGTGVVHSEMNEGSETCRFLQIWITPDRRGHLPQYGSFTTVEEQRRNTLLAVLQGTGKVPEWAHPLPGEPIRLHQDATVVVSENDAGIRHTFDLGAGRQLYAVCMEGGLKVVAGGGEEVLDTREAVEIVAPKGGPLRIEVTSGHKGAHAMLIELRRPDVEDS